MSVREAADGCDYPDRGQDQRAFSDRGYLSRDAVNIT